MAGLPRLGTGGGGATAELSTFGTSVKSTVRRHLGRQLNCNAATLAKSDARRLQV